MIGWIAFAAPAMAGMPPIPMLIGFASDEGGPAASCQVLFRSQSGALHSICSATLVSRTRLVTAAHCVEHLDGNAAPPTVRCGYQGFNDDISVEITSLGGRVDTGSPQFAETLSVRRVEISGRYDPTTVRYDSAILTLDGEASTPPIPLATEADHQAILTAGGLAPGAECRVSGYGVAPHGLAGYLRSAPVSADGLARLGGASDQVHSVRSAAFVDSGLVRSCEDGEMFGSTEMDAPAIIRFFKSVHRNGGIDSGLAPGDSGGGLICRRSPQSTWMLYGVNSFVRYEEESPTTATGEHSGRFTQTDVWSDPTKTAYEELWRAPR